MTGDNEAFKGTDLLSQGRYMNDIKDQVYGNDPLFFRMMRDRPVVLGPPDPKFRIDCIEVRYLPHGAGDDEPRIEIGCDGWESETAYLTRDQMQELLDGLRSVCPTSWNLT